MAGGNELVFRVRLDGSGKIVSDLQSVESGIKRVSEAGSGGSRGAREVADDLRGLKGHVESLNTSAATLADLFSRSLGIGAFGLAVSGTVRAMVDAQVSAAKLQATLSYVAGGTEGATKELDYLRQAAYRLGLDFKSSATAYSKFAAATKESGVSAEVTRQTFEGIAKAAQTMGLASEETAGALLALSQMASKGVVSAEELRGQLGERLPGAFALAAKAMGVTERELSKMLEKGEIATADFLPRFARALNESFSQPVNNVVSELNRLSSAFDLFKQGLFAGNSGSLFTPLTNGLNEAAAAMRKLGNDSTLTYRLLIAVGGAMAGAAGSQTFDLVGRQKRLMDNDLPEVKRQIEELEARKDASVFNRLNLIDQGRLDDLKKRAAAIRSELLDLAGKIGQQTGFKSPDLKGQVDAERARAAEKLKAYLDDTASETKSVKIAKAVEDENAKFEKATSGLDKASKDYAAALEAHQRRVAEIQSKGIEKARGSADRTIDVEEQRYKRLQELTRQLNDDLRAIEQQARAASAMDETVQRLQKTYDRSNQIYDERDLPQAQRELAEALRQVAEQADSARDSLAQKAATLRVDDVQALEAYRQAMVAVGEEEVAQLERIRLREAEQERLNGLWETGAERAFRKYSDSGKSVAQQTEEAFTRAFAGMEDALMRFLETGKLNFADFAKALIADMARIELRALLTKNAGGGSGGGGAGLGGVLGKLGGWVMDLIGLGSGWGTSGTTNAFMTNGVALRSALGNAFGPLGRIEPFAAGGVVSRPTLFRFARGGVPALGQMGESGPEAILPLSRDRAGRLGVRSSGAGRVTEVHVHVNGAGSTLADIRQASGQGARRALQALSGARRYG